MDKIGEKIKLFLEQYHQTVMIVLCALVVILFLAVVAGCSSSTSPIPPAEGQQGVDTISWTNPDQWTDGSPLTASQLTGIKIQWGTVPGGPYADGSLDVVAGAPGSSQQATVDGHTIGTRCYVAFALAGTISSNASAEACKTITGPPKSPTNLTVQ